MILKGDRISIVLVKEVTMQDSPDWAPTYLFSIRDSRGRHVGTCDLRVKHTRLTYYAGNIGYHILSPYRGKGYAKDALTLLLKFAKSKNMTYLYVSCDKDNKASIRVVENLNGKFIEECKVPERDIKRLGGYDTMLVYKFNL